MSLNAQLKELAGRLRRRLTNNQGTKLPADPALWRDLGLGPADRMAIAAGFYANDPTRRQR